MSPKTPESKDNMPSPQQEPTTTLRQEELYKEVASSEPRHRPLEELGTGHGVPHTEAGHCEGSCLMRE